ncbi:MAG: SDR family NAD(P)-dependent oxidoreductase [Deltaproteobacteria bacterium]|nr:SDR family NAD(P)-dependent oxidoreductase [Deltaproteobacteria bacterium]
MGLLDGRVALVTGAGRGIGREEALLLAMHGAKLVVNDLGGGFDGSGKDIGPAAEVTAEIKKMGGEAVTNGDSVSDFKGAKRMLECALDNFKSLDIVVNNAGILRDRMLFNMSEDDWDAVLAVHLKGTFAVTRHAAEYWRNKNKETGKPVNGRVINTSSDSGLLGNASQSNYGAAKAAIAAFSGIVDQELRKYGVTVNTIAPVARTRLTVDATPATATLMAKKPGPGEFDVFDPGNIAPLVVWLASDEAKDVHGQVFRVGGRSVWVMQSWHSVGRVKGEGRWDPAALGKALQPELAKVKKETMNDVFSSGL